MCVCLDETAALNLFLVSTPSSILLSERCPCNWSQIVCLRCQKRFISFLSFRQALYRFQMEKAQQGSSLFFRKCNAIMSLTPTKSCIKQQVCEQVPLSMDRWDEWKCVRENKIFFFFVAAFLSGIPEDNLFTRLFVCAPMFVCSSKC